MDIKEVFELSKTSVDSGTTYVKQIRNNLFEVHATREDNSNIEYVVQVCDGEIHVLFTKGLIITNRQGD